MDKSQLRRLKVQSDKSQLKRLKVHSEMVPLVSSHRSKAASPDKCHGTTSPANSLASHDQTNLNQNSPNQNNLNQNNPNQNNLSNNRLHHVQASSNQRPVEQVHAVLQVAAVAARYAAMASTASMRMPRRLCVDLS